MANEQNQVWHEEGERFREALGFTAAQTGFSARLIEKDYYCSISLRELAPLHTAGLVFKGGTALSKVHANFYRLSEDLDFAISIASDASRTARRAAIQPVKRHLADLRSRATWLDGITDLTGANESTQYLSELTYVSCLSGEVESIRLEIALREPLVQPSEMAPAMTILMNPLTTLAAHAPFSVSVISRQEAYAEKIRAALCRREAAIRDFYDLDHALEAGIVGRDDAGLLELANRKIAIPFNDAPDLSPERLGTLRQQIHPQLRPVLREEDFHRFDLDRVVDTLRRWGYGG